MESGPLSTPDPRQLVQTVVQDFARGHQRAKKLAPPPATQPSTKDIEDFILKNLVAPKEDWKHLQDSNPKEFREELKKIPSILTDYLKLVTKIAPIHFVTPDQLENGKVEHLATLELNWKCDMYLLRIC
ncbi:MULTISPECIES: hypothetical protein [Streptomyces]|uniref:hypothetical protein n=1 Tax=Streptomyces TaxID=1883 RepID=UPI00345C1103